MEVKTFGVIGAGQMGNGIAQVAAAAGLNVIMNDISDDFVKRGMNTIIKNLARSVEKGKLAAETRDAVLGRIKTSSDIKDMAAADFVVEAATERQDLKFGIFKNLDGICRPEVILATNTSSIPIGRIAAQTRRPDKIIGMHFMNPVPVMKLVEVVRGTLTSEATVQSVLKLATRLGKTSIVSQDRPGFLVNRILIPLLNEACFALEEGVGSMQDIDAGARLGLGHPLGPLELADLIGLDTVLSIAEILHRDFGDPKYRPCPLLRNLVQAGLLGKKTGRGFYTYDADGKKI